MSRELGFPKVYLKISSDEKSNSLTRNELVAYSLWRHIAEVIFSETNGKQT